MLKDDEIKTFNSENEMMIFFGKQKETDTWKRCYTQEISIIGMQNNPIMANITRSELNIDSEVTDDQIVETMNDTKLLVVCPLEKERVFPLRRVAFKSLTERAGLSGNSMNTFEDTSRQNELDPIYKADMLNKCLNLYKDKSLILLRDNKVSAVLSGDNNDYVVLPMYDLIKVMSGTLSLNFPFFEFARSFTSHEISLVEWLLKDVQLEKSIENTFKKSNVLLKEKPRLIVQLSTSDVGIRSVTIVPYLALNKRTIPVGTPIFLPHKGKTSLALLEKETLKILALYRKSGEMLDKLQDKLIRYPAGALYHVSQALKLPKKASVLKAKEIESEYVNCSALEIYCFLQEIIDLYEESCKEPLQPLKKLKYDEAIASALYFNFSDYDMPVME